MRVIGIKEPGETQTLKSAEGDSAGRLAARIAATDLFTPCEFGKAKPPEK